MSWARARAFLLPALDGDSETDVVQALRQGLAQLWLGRRSAIVTQLTVTWEIHVWLAGGELDDLLSLVPGAEAWARALTCTHVTIDGRRGWARALKRHGYAPHGDLLRKAL